MSKCLNPTQVWICGTRVCKDGIVSPRIVFSFNDAHQYYSDIYGYDEWKITKAMEHNGVSQPCGRCAACQIMKRKHMATRLAHEASCHETACFLTLTYDEDHVPTTDFRPIDDPEKVFDTGLGSLPELTLVPAHVQKFVKRLRRHLEYLPKLKHDGRDHVTTPIRYFAVGEYGSKTHRPHYHIIIFGWSPSDKDLFKLHNGNPVYRSKQIEKLWPFGFSSVSDVNTQVARYCARYVTKKFTRLTSPLDLNDVIPEFVLTSKKDGGIGAPWFRKFGNFCCPLGFCNVNSRDKVIKCAIPPYYLRLLRRFNPSLWLRCRDQRISFVRSHIGLSSAYADVRRMVDVFYNTDNKRNENEVF